MIHLSSLRALTISALFTIVQAANAAPPQASEHRIECPAEMPEESLTYTVAPAGWTPLVRSPMRLHAIDIMDGPPSQKGFLKPDFVTSRGGKSVDKWINLDVGRIPGGTWIACNYGSSDNLILAKRLDDKVSECSATYLKDAQGGTAIDIRCKW